MIYKEEEEVEQLMNDNMGICIACGEEVEMVEPDAEGYKCPVCGEFKVMGIENALLIGEISTEGE